MAAMETAHRFSLCHFRLLQSEKSLKPCIFTSDIPKLLDSHFRTCRSETSSESHLHGPENLRFSVAVARHSRVASGSRRKQEEDELARHSQSRRPGSARTRQGIEPGEIGSDKIHKIIDDMISSMRKAPLVGLAAPQIGIPLRIIVLEDTKEYISHAPKGEIKAQDIRPFDLLVIINPKLKKKSNRTALFFEGVDGFRAVVERYLDVEVDGLDRCGNPIKVNASGWQACILQHECDHLEGTLYVDKMVPKTFRTVDNFDLPLADGCPKLGVR